MSTFLEKDMKVWLKNCDCLASILINGESAIGKLNDDVNVKISYYGGIEADKRNGFLVEIINKKTGNIDRMVFKYSDVIGKYKLPSGSEISYHIWKGMNGFEWYSDAPTTTQRKKIMERVYAYIALFK